MGCEYDTGSEKAVRQVLNGRNSRAMGGAGLMRGAICPETKLCEQLLSHVHEPRGFGSGVPCAGPMS